MCKHGKLIVFEGPDGAGKTTLSQYLHEQLKKQSVPSEYFSFPGKEEGTLGNLVYRIHHNPEDYGVQSVNPISKQVLHIAAHVDAILGRILPALQDGKIVILDRFWWSTWVYGHASGLSEQSLNGMLAVEFDQWGMVSPAIVFLITGSKPKRTDEPPHEWVAHTALYEELATQEKQRYPVETVSNEGTVEHSLDIILRRLQILIPQATGKFRS